MPTELTVALVVIFYSIIWAAYGIWQIGGDIRDRLDKIIELLEKD